MAKPTDDILWAEGGGASVTNPTSKRTDGWVVKDKLPAANANYLWRALGRYANWLAGLFDTNGELTQDVADGSLVATTDGSTRELDHVGVGATTLVTSDIVRGRSEVRVGQTGTNDEGVILSEDTTGAPLDVARLVVAPVDPALDAGVFSGTFAPELVTAPNADYRSIFPYDEALYRANLAKLCGQILIQDVGATGAYNTVTIAGGHNLASVALIPGTPDIIQITPTDAFTASTVICTVGPQPGGTLPRPVIFGGVSHTTITAIAFVGGAWVDLFGAGVATSLGVANLRLNILAF